ncbi:MAG: hypothetical protein MAG715_00242 [Methanonatronarchaeales archaeon]|nr:hypothetical protein [Methanonatronarchaeales archaeon]
MKAVLDTNVLISGIITNGVSHSVLVRGFRGDYRIVASVEILGELQETLLKYPEKFQMEKEEVQEEVETVEYYATFVNPTEEVREIRDDPSDNVFLEAAVAGNASYVVSGDRHLLELGRFRGTEVLTPGQFLKKLKKLIDHR